MPSGTFDAVTGAFGYTGRHIAHVLLSRGRKVLTLTRRGPEQSAFASAMTVRPLRFDDPDHLTRCLTGVETLYNTYWVRFCHGGASFDRAVVNTGILLRAAQRAGVRRVVHISVSNPSLDSDLPYYRGKAQAEAVVRASGLSHAIIRPTLIFGDGDILINNIAYLLRRLPVFVVPGSGEYRLQPVFAGDLAELAASAGARRGNEVFDAAGPDTFTFRGLVQLIAAKIKRPARLLCAPPPVALFVARIIGWALGDVLLTREEARGLMAELLVSRQTPLGTTRLCTWLAKCADQLGRRYASELHRHFNSILIGTATYFDARPAR